MSRKLSFVAVVIAALSLMTGGAIAAHHYLITSTKQIKPSVLKQFQARLAAVDVKDVPGAFACAAGTPGGCEVANSEARCPPGGIAVGGGFDGGSTPPVDATVADNEVDADGQGWHVTMVNHYTGSGVTWHAIVECIGVIGHFAKATRANPAPASVRLQIRQELARARSRATR